MRNRVDLDVVCFVRFADELPMDLTGLGDVNYDISIDSGLAAEAAIVGKTSTLPKMCFCLTRIGKV